MRNLALDNTRAIGEERIRMGKRSRVAPFGSISHGTAHMEPVAMLTLFSYPDLFGVADNNPYGLKVFAFLKLCGLPLYEVHYVKRYLLRANAVCRTKSG